MAYGSSETVGTGVTCNSSVGATSLAPNGTAFSGTGLNGSLCAVDLVAKDFSMTVYNFAVPGGCLATTTNCPYSIQGNLPSTLATVIAANPLVSKRRIFIHMEAGVDDAYGILTTPAAFYAAYQAMITAAEAQGIPGGNIIIGSMVVSNRLDVDAFGRLALDAL